MMQLLQNEDALKCCLKYRMVRMRCQFCNTLTPKMINSCREFLDLSALLQECQINGTIYLYEEIGSVPVIGLWAS